MGKDLVVAYFEVAHYPGYFLWRPKKAKKSLGQDRWSLGRDFNSGIP
jgi:hypothetical protein